jgi:hypothetical protein
VSVLEVVPDWDSLDKRQRQQYIRMLEKEVKCKECGGSLVVVLSRVWMLHEMSCRWRNYVRLAGRTSSAARSFVAQ